MKPQLFRLETPLVMHCLGVARARTREAGLLRQIEKQSKVRGERFRGPGVERPQFVEVDEPAESLIRESGVGKAVAENDRSPLQRRADDLDDMLSPRRRKEKKLSDGIEMRAAVEKDGPDPIRQRCATRLFGDDSTRDPC